MADKIYTPSDVNEDELIEIMVSKSKSMQSTGEPTTPVMIWGRPGCGKSHLIHQVALMTGRPIIDIRGFLERQCVRELSYFDVESSEMNFAEPIDASVSNDCLVNAIILVDELPTDATLQAATLRLLIDKKIINCNVSPEVMIVALGIQETENMMDNSLYQKLINRFDHFNLITNVNR